MADRMTFLEILLFVVGPAAFIFAVTMVFIAARREIRKTDKSEYKVLFTGWFYWCTLWAGIGLVFIALVDMFFIPPQARGANPETTLGAALLVWLTDTGCLYYFTGRVWPSNDPG
jgi:hypothetical protein